MAKLTMKKRESLPKEDFAIPSKAPASGSYPVENKSRAMAALSMVSRYGDSSEKAQVRSKVAEKYPSMDRHHAILATIKKMHKHKEK